MAGLLSKLFGKQNAQMRDAERIYVKTLAHARKPVFYGESKVPDNYDGRIDFLTLHIAIILKAVRPHGAEGKRLSQAIFDYMRDDFDIALREEGISDTGVAKRIKPMMQLFYGRLKTYDDALNQNAPHPHLIKAFESGLLIAGEDKTEGADVSGDAVMETQISEEAGRFATQLAAFCVVWSDRLMEMPLGDIALAKLDIPDFQG